MPPLEPFILETQAELEQRTGHKRFPALAQFAILVTVLGVLLGGFVLPFVFGKNAQKELSNLPPEINNNTTKETINFVAPSNLLAKSIFVYDVTSNQTIFEKDAQKSLPLASITKLMTGLVANQILEDSAPVSISNSASAQASASGLKPGEVLKSKELLDFAMLASSNDAAYALAEGGGRILTDSQHSAHQAFVEAMNITAEELGLSSLHFKNATGLDISPTTSGSVGSAADVSRLMAFLVNEHRDVLEVTTQNNERIYSTTGQYHDAENTNPIINKIPNLLGSKTGYTDLAQGNLTIAFDAGYNRPVVITVLGSTYDGRFDDVLKLVKAVQSAYNQ